VVPGDGTEVSQRCGGDTYEQGELRGRVGEERGGKETDGCPLTPSETEFRTMSDAKAIENICMALPVSEEEVHQANIKIKSPHNWYDVATKIINEFNR
jgi:hypothetical protein